MADITVDELREHLDRVPGWFTVGVHPAEDYDHTRGPTAASEHLDTLPDVLAGSVSFEINLGECTDDHCDSCDIHERYSDVNEEVERLVREIRDRYGFDVTAGHASYEVITDGVLQLLTYQAQMISGLLASAGGRPAASD